MAVRQGLPIPDKNAGSTPFTCTTSGELWVSRVKNVYQTRLSSTRRALPARLHLWINTTFSGSATSDEWMMDDSPKISCKESLPLVPGLQECPSYDSRMSANETWGQEHWSSRLEGSDWRLQWMEKYHEGIRSEERGVERTVMGREERVQTVEGRFPALEVRHSFRSRFPATTATQPPTEIWQSSIVYQDRQMPTTATTDTLNTRIQERMD